MDQIEKSMKELKRIMDKPMTSEREAYMELFNLKEKIRFRAKSMQFTSVLKDPFSSKKFEKNLLGREVITRADLYEAYNKGYEEACEHCRSEIMAVLDGGN